MKKFNMSRIKMRRAYTMLEVSKTIGASLMSVRRWHRQGLKSMNPGEVPLLFLGEEVVRFEIERRQKTHFNLRPDEIFCLCCKKPRKSLKEKIELHLTGRKIGKKEHQVQVTGICKECGGKLSRMTTISGLKKLKFSKSVLQRFQVLLENQQSYSDDIMEGGEE